MKRKFLAFLVCLASLAACVFAGCEKTEEQGVEDSGGANVVSYVSENSEVYSSTAEVVEAVADSVVEISTESVTTQWGMQYIVSGAGSGVIVGKAENGAYYIITNNHVIDGANDITVRTRTGEEYKATLVATDDSEDIAVVTVTSETELNIATFGNSDSLKIGEDLIAIGNPMGSLGGTVTKGILSATGRTIVVGDFAMTLLQTDTAINPGNSGGGLFNMRGELIGVVNAKTTDEEIEGICFAIPSNKAKSVYTDLVEHGYVVGRATFPITVSAGSISTGINTQAQTIVYVTNVGDVPDGTFKLYDRIYKLNGKEISSLSDYNGALKEISPNESVTVQVYRGTRTQSMFGGSISFASDVTEFEVTALQYGEK